MLGFNLQNKNFIIILCFKLKLYYYKMNASICLLIYFSFVSFNKYQFNTQSY